MKRIYLAAGVVAAFTAAFTMTFRGNTTPRVYTNAERSTRTAEILHQACDRFERMNPNEHCGGIEIRFDDGAVGRLVTLNYNVPLRLPRDIGADRLQYVDVRLNDGSMRRTWRDHLFGLAGYRHVAVYYDGSIPTERPLD